MGSSIFNGFVVAGGLARSAVNAEGGAKTPFAGAISASLIILALLFLTSLFYYLPMATLGAIIEVSVVSMMDFEAMEKAYKGRNYQDLCIIVITALCVFFVGISYGLLVGVTLSFLVPMYYAAFPTVSHSSHRTDYASVGIDDPTEGAEGDPSLTSHSQSVASSYVLVNMTSPLFFPNLTLFSEEVMAAVDHLVKSLSGEGEEGDKDGENRTEVIEEGKLYSPCEEKSPALETLAVVVDGSSWGKYLDLPAINTLKDLCKKLRSEHKENAVVYMGLVNVHEDVVVALERGGVIGETVTAIRPSLVFRDLHTCALRCTRILKALSLDMSGEGSSGKGNTQAWSGEAEDRGVEMLRSPKEVSAEGGDAAI